jgi:dihydroorotase
MQDKHELPPVLLKQPYVVNEGVIHQADVLLKDGYIARIASTITPPEKAYTEVKAAGLYLMPGIIDNHVHFREPGLTHKGTIGTESRAAVAGGVTATMEMPNTIPQTVNQAELAGKYRRASATSWTNHAFYLGATKDNIEAIKQANAQDICGIKVFMGSSTGNMLVDDPETLAGILQGCYQASELITGMAREYQARLHILHLTTADEVPLFDSAYPPEEKLITTEACVHHLWFNSADYTRWGNKLKCFPAIKAEPHRQALLEGLQQGAIDQIASDHAPHALVEKQRGYAEAPGGIPMIQHNLPAMLAFYHQGLLSLTQIAEKMAHNPAKTYRVKERGFIKEGYKADCVLVDPEQPLRVDSSTLQSKARWSPFEDCFWISLPPSR